MLHTKILPEGASTQLPTSLSIHHINGQVADRSGTHLPLGFLLPVQEVGSPMTSVPAFLLGLQQEGRERDTPQKLDPRQLPWFASMGTLTLYSVRLQNSMSKQNEQTQNLFQNRVVFKRNLGRMPYVKIYILKMKHLYQQHHLETVLTISPIAVRW